MGRKEDVEEKRDLQGMEDSSRTVGKSWVCSGVLEQRNGGKNIDVMWKEGM